MPVPLPDNEAHRLARLRALSVLDTAPEPLFDGLAEAAAMALGTPMAGVNLIDADRQWTKAGVGLEVGASRPRDETFCAHAVLQDTVLEVADARTDPRFADNPAVT
jgi:GAF domain-containing protein